VTEKRDTRKKNKRIPKNVRVLDSGEWEILVPYYDTSKPKIKLPNGKERHPRRTATERTELRTKKEIEAKVAEMRAAIQKKLSPPPERKIFTVKEYLEDWLEHVIKKQVQTVTYQDYRESVEKRIVPVIGSVPLENLNHEHIQKFCDAIEKKGHIRQLHKTFKLLNQVLRRAVRQGDILANPCERVTLPKYEKKQIAFVSLEEAHAFLEKCETAKHGLILEIALETGARPGEYLAMDWKDINFKRNTWTINRSVSFPKKTGFKFVPPKTKSSRRTIVLSDYLIERLKEHQKGWKKNPYNLVFATSEGTPHNYNNVRNRYFRDVANSVGISEKVTLYSLRHSCATLLLADKTNPKDVQERLGHASIITLLDNYAHVQEGRQAETTNAMNNLLRPVKKKKKPEKKAVRIARPSD
jgi:integrase